MKINLFWKILLLFFISANVYADILISETVIGGGSSNIEVAGNWTNNGIFTANSSTVIFNGSSEQTIGGSNTTTFFGTTIDNSSSVTLGLATTVNGILTLTSGNITSTAGAILTLGSSASVNGGSDASFVNGPLVNTWSSSSGEKTFPVGKGSTYRPLAINVSSATTAEMRAEVFNANAGGTSSLARISTVRYYQTNVTLGSVGNIADAKIIYDSDDGVSDHTTLVVARSLTLTGEYSSLGRSASDPSSVTSAIYDPTEAGEFLLLGSTSTDNSLPVELSSFSATAGDGQVTLVWTTESEMENQAFILERSEDNDNFVKIAEIPGQGNCSHRTEYTYKDEKVTAGQIYYYRLCDRSINGMVSYHTTVTAIPNAAVIKEYVLLPAYPNPFNPEVTIRFTVPNINETEATISLIVYNVLGQKAATLYEGPIAGGQYEMKWNAVNQPTGVYFIYFQSEDFVRTQKMILIR